MAATVVTLTADMGESMIKTLVDEAFDSLFATGSVATTSQVRVAGFGQQLFAENFNANMALLETGVAGLDAQTDVVPGSWNSMISACNTALAAAKVAVDAL